VNDFVGHLTTSEMTLFDRPCIDSYQCPVVPMKLAPYFAPFLRHSKILDENDRS